MPDQNIIIHVVSASSEFVGCESTTLLQGVESIKDRTLLVVTKCDKFTNQSLLDEVEKVNGTHGAGTIFLRNRINNETFIHARDKEESLFEFDPFLRKLDKSTVGIQCLATKLLKIQSTTLLTALPVIRQKINGKLCAVVADFDTIKGVESRSTYMQIYSFLKDLQKIFIHGEIGRHDNKYKNCHAHLNDMIRTLSESLQSHLAPNNNFLMEEIEALKKAHGPWLPPFHPRPVFLKLLNQKVKSVCSAIIVFAHEVWEYLKTVCEEVVADHCGKFPKLNAYMRTTTERVTEKMRLSYVERVDETIKIESITYHTRGGDCDSCYQKLMERRDEMLSSMKYESEYGVIDLEHLNVVPVSTVSDAFDLNMRITAYLRFVVQRMLDFAVIQLHVFIHKAVHELEDAIMNAEKEDVIHKMMMCEAQELAERRKKLKSRVDLLSDILQRLKAPVD